MSDIAAIRISKVQRQHLIARLLVEHDVQNQDQLVALLAKQRCTATQATVSRDLDDLGAIKVRGPDGDSVYAIPELPKDQRAPEDHLRRVFTDWVVEIDHSANLVIVRTPPGTANVVGSALDRCGHDHIAGTVAGDDTVLIVARESMSGRDLAAELRALTGP